MSEQNSKEELKGLRYIIRRSDVKPIMEPITTKYLVRWVCLTSGLFFEKDISGDKLISLSVLDREGKLQILNVNEFL